MIETTRKKKWRKCLKHDQCLYLVWEKNFHINLFVFVLFQSSTVLWQQNDNHGLLSYISQCQTLTRSVEMINKSVVCDLLGLCHRWITNLQLFLHSSGSGKRLRTTSCRCITSYVASTSLLDATLRHLELSQSFV